MDSGKIHPDLLERWQTALFDVNLFKYNPTVVHGSLKSDFVLTEGHDVVGVIEWGNLSIDDPAADLAFVFGEAQPDIADAITLAYEGSTRADRNIKQRAHLYYELSYASYLLSCINRGIEEDIETAAAMLSDLHAELLAGNLPSLRPSDFASSTPEVIVPISQAASFTAPVAIVTDTIEVVDLAESTPKSEPNPKRDEDELF
jgi:hypothetical protein